MLRVRALLLSLACLLGLVCPRPLFACTEILLIEPAAGSRVGESVLSLRWQALPGISEYRLEAEARRPEAGIAWAVDLIVKGSAYRLDVPETTTPLAVKLRLSAGCDALGSMIRSQPAHVLIDRR